MSRIVKVENLTMKCLVVSPRSTMSPSTSSAARFFGLDRAERCWQNDAVQRDDRSLQAILGAS